MNLQTQIPIKKEDNHIDYSSKLLLLGSCFSQNIGDKLAYFKFRSLQNPFGILFHSLAIENLIARAVDKKLYTEEDIFYFNERWQTYDAHSDLSATTKEDLLSSLNSALIATRAQIETGTHIILTLGTAWVYKLKETNTIVANCHKVPQKEFEKYLLPVSEIVFSLESVIKKIQTINKQVKILFTISPVRHLKDGFVENQRSKAHLITAIHSLLSSRSDSSVGYFPSYELMMDEMRDYRFYAQDMIHPNQLAIDYIWEKFKDTWTSNGAQETMNKIDDIQKGLRHRPFHPESAQHQNFLKSLQAKIAYIKEIYPFVEFN